MDDSRALEGTSDGRTPRGASASTCSDILSDYSYREKNEKEVGREQRKKSGEESSSRAKSCGDQHAEKGPRNYFDFGVRGPYSFLARHDLDPVHAHDHHVTDLHIRCAYNMDHIPPRLADGSFVAYD